MRQTKDKENRDIQRRTGEVKSREPRAAPPYLGGEEDKERVECLIRQKVPFSFCMSSHTLEDSSVSVGGQLVVESLFFPLGREKRAG